MVWRRLEPERSIRDREVASIVTRQPPCHVQPFRVGGGIGCQIPPAVLSHLNSGVTCHRRCLCHICDPYIDADPVVTTIVIMHVGL